MQVLQGRSCQLGRSRRWRRFKALLPVLAFGLAQAFSGLHSHASDLEEASAPSLCAVCAFAQADLLPSPSSATQIRGQLQLLAPAAMPAEVCLGRRADLAQPRAPPTS